jgi:hypothetical protein
MKSPPAVSVPTDHPNRREFLAKGAALAFLPTISLVSAHASRLVSPLFDRAVTRAHGMLGYWVSSEGIADLDGAVRDVLKRNATPTGVVSDEADVAPFAPNVISAEELPSGDPHFLETGVRLGVYGFGPGVSSEMMALEQCFSIAIPLAVQDEAGSPLEWCAWTHQRDGLCCNTSSPVVSTLPVNSDHAFRLLLTQRWGEESAMKTELCLTSGSSSGVAKLRRGLYFLPVATRVGAGVPNWRRLQWRNACNVSGEVRGLAARRVLSGRLTTPDFDYVVISVAHNAH